MANSQISKLLEFANMQMAAEAFLARVEDTIPNQPPPAAIRDRLVDGNFHPSKFMPVQAERFTKERGSGLANCMKVPAESFGESIGLSRAFFDTGEGMTEGRDIAPEGLGERGQRGSSGPERKPGNQRTSLGRNDSPLDAASEGFALSIKSFSPVLKSNKMADFIFNTGGL